MKRTLMVLAAACALLLTLGAAPAFADGLLPGAPPASGQSVTNGTDQSNQAVSVNVPIASGNNVALINGGDQTASADTTQDQENENSTWQDASQSSAPSHGCGCSSASDQSVANGTDQSNQAVSVNVPIVSGNNVALINGGDQTASAGTTQNQENENSTWQDASQSSAPSHGCGCSSASDQSVANHTDQSNEAVSVNVPIASGNNVALINHGDQTASAGTTQNQENENATSQQVEQSSGGGSGGDQQVSNRTRQENKAVSVNVPIASGNNVALVNCGHQDASAGTTQNQKNENWTWQDVRQTSHGGGGGGDPSVRNRTSQENRAVSVNVPIASGNNLALINGGGQTASAGTTQTQENENSTWQDVEQSSTSSCCHPCPPPNPCEEAIHW